MGLILLVVVLCSFLVFALFLSSMVCRKDRAGLGSSLMSFHFSAVGVRSPDGDSEGECVFDHVRFVWISEIRFCNVRTDDLPVI